MTGLLALERMLRASYAMPGGSAYAPVSPDCSSQALDRAAGCGVDHREVRDEQVFVQHPRIHEVPDDLGQAEDQRFIRMDGDFGGEGAHWRPLFSFGLLDLGVLTLVLFAFGGLLGFMGGLALGALR